MTTLEPQATPRVLRLADSVARHLDHLNLVARVVSGPGIPSTWAAFAYPLASAVTLLRQELDGLSEIRELGIDRANVELICTMEQHAARTVGALLQEERLLKKYVTLRDSAEFKNLPLHHQRLVHSEIEAFRTHGVHLHPAERQRLLEIQCRLLALQAVHEANVQNATAAFTHCVTDGKLLQGLPEGILQLFRDAAEADGRDGWKLTLIPVHWAAVMQCSDHRPLRELAYRAYVTRASELGPGQWDNGHVLVEMFRLRQEQARLLGFESYAQFVSDTKKTTVPTEALDFLDALAERVREDAEEEWRVLKAFATCHFGVSDLQPWDIPYVVARLQRSRGVGDEQVRKYFPAPHVVSEALKFLGETFGFTVHRVGLALPHERRHQFSVRSAAGETGELTVIFTYDAFGAEGRTIATTRRGVSGVPAPVASVYVNVPDTNSPVLLSHGQVVTLFHELGHALHHLLTRPELLGVCGFDGGDLETLELPSQTVERFANEWPVIERVSRHVETGLPIPRAAYDGLRAVRSTWRMLDQADRVALALFDLRVHHDADIERPEDLLRFVREVYAKVSAMPLPSFFRGINTASHLCSPRYAGRYYTYLTADSEAERVFEGMWVGGAVNRDAAHKFVKEVLQSESLSHAVEV